MKIGGVQKLSLIDYPNKICCVVFIAGCNFKCGFCHNPEIVFENTEFIEEEEFFSFLSSRRNWIDGVCIGGGEPCASDIILFVRKIKEMGFLVKIDTNGSFPNVLEYLINGRLVDYIAMDVKAPFDKYKQVVNSDVDVGDIKKSIKIIKGSGVEYEFRTTCVPKLLSKEDIINIGLSLGKCKKYCLQKFVSQNTLDKNYLNEKTYSEKELNEIKEIIKEKFDVCEVR